MCKTTVEITPKNDSAIYIQFFGTPKPISGHRFTSLLGLDKLSDTIIAFDLFGLRFQGETKPMLLGKVMESSCIDYLYGDEIYLTYGFKEYNGNALDLKGENDVNGLPDAILPEYNLLVENKVTTRYKECQERWKKQAQFYAYWWNKLRKEDTGIEIKEVEVVRYFVDEIDLEWQLEHKDKIIENNIATFRFGLETEQIEEDMKTVLKKRDELINRKYEVRKTYTQMLRWLAIGVIRKLVKLKYDKKDKVSCKFVKLIDKYVKDLRKEWDNNED